MFPARPFSAATAALLSAALSFAFFFSTAGALAAGESDKCEAAGEVAVLPSPLAPWKGAPLRVLAAAEKPIKGELSLIAPDGHVAIKTHDQQGGPPYFWFAEIASPAAGTWRATLVRDGAPAGCGTVTRDIVVSGQKPPGPRAAESSIWPVRSTWTRATENLYSAWIAKLFDAPLDAEPSWKSWHEVLRDRSRNMLFDYLGLGEDNVTVSLRPDCADFVYFLRAYFAFKMGLPFAYSNCSRGKGGAPPKCYEWFDIQHPGRTRPTRPPEQTIASAEPASAAPNALGLLTSPSPAARPAKPPKRLGQAASFAQYLRAVGDVVHSGSVRVSANDDNTDFYTVPLTEQSLRPGTVYADPYGHVLMIVRRVPQMNGSAGVILAVDAEPDGTVTRKRFWRGNFLFAHEPALGSPGFKRFRPIMREANGSLRRLTNAEIAKNPQYGDFSLDQSRLAVEAFYDRVDDVMSPEPLDPLRAMQDAIQSLEEQVKTRVTAVENGRKFQGGGREASMPDGPAIFATNGPWEDFSTPARDFRLLIAIDMVRGFPDRVVRRSERYAMPAGKSTADVKAELRAALAAELAGRKFSYTRSDGSAWSLSLKDVLDRAVDFEMAYNPNDCVELRWGAAAGSEEASTCRRRAPQAQRAKMANYRAWFQKRHWPVGG